MNSTGRSHVPRTLATASAKAQVVRSLGVAITTSEACWRAAASHALSGPAMVTVPPARVAKCSAHSCASASAWVPSCTSASRSKTACGDAEAERVTRTGARAARTTRSATDPSHHRPGPRRPCVPSTMRSAVADFADDCVDRRRVHDHRLHGVTSGADSELLQMRGRGHLRRKSLRFEPSDLLEGEVGRRLEPLGMHDPKPCLEARRHHSGEGHRACRGVAEIDTHEDGLRWAVCHHGSGTPGVTSIVCTVTARSPRSWRFAM